MDAIKKALAKLPKKYQAIFDLLIYRLTARDFLGLDLVKLKGHKDVYRVKQGKLRIIFRMDGDRLLILEVGLRSEKTYRNF